MTPPIDRRAYNTNIATWITIALLGGIGSLMFVAVSDHFVTQDTALRVVTIEKNQATVIEKLAAIERKLPPELTRPVARNEP